MTSSMRGRSPSFSRRRIRCGRLVYSKRAATRWELSALLTASTSTLGYSVKSGCSTSMHSLEESVPRPSRLPLPERTPRTGARPKADGRHGSLLSEKHGASQVEGCTRRRGLPHQEQGTTGAGKDGVRGTLCPLPLKQTSYSRCR